MVTLTAVSVPLLNEQCELVVTETGNPLEELVVTAVVLLLERDRRLNADEAEIVCDALTISKLIVLLRAKYLESSGAEKVSRQIPLVNGVI